MNKNWASLLKMMVEIIQNHGDRIEALEREEFHENTGDANLMEEVTSLLAKLQTPESGFAMKSVPSDQM
jgi:hypothetical protein